MKKIIFTIGCPGSGKSHTANEFYQDNYSGLKSVTINADDIRQEFTGRQDDFTKDKAVWKALFQRFEDALLNPSVEVILVTNTSVNVKARVPYYKIMMRIAYTDEIAFDMKYLVFPPDVDACMELQKNRERMVPRKIVENFASRFAAPDTILDFSAVVGKHEVIVVDTADNVKAAKGFS